MSMFVCTCLWCLFIGYLLSIPKQLLAYIVLQILSCFNHQSALYFRVAKVFIIK